MERIISYDELPKSTGQVVYFRMETDPKLYFHLLAKGYKVINHIINADDNTIYLTGKRQDYNCGSVEDYKEYVESKMESILGESNITKPNTCRFNYKNLKEHKYKLPFVL